MKTSVEKIDDHTVKLSVTVPAEEVDKAIDEAYKRLAKKVKVPGFRIGKAPKPVIDNQLGREAVLAEAQEELVTRSYQEALDAEGLRPIAQPEIGELELITANADFVYEASVQVRPELTLSSIEDLKVEVPPREVSDAEIDAHIDGLRERFATLEPVTDRGAGPKDFVLLSFVGKIDGQEYEGNTVDKYLYEMGRGLMPDEFEAAIIGVEPGGTAQASFVVPETSSMPEFVGKTATFDITVHEIKAKALPDVDDEFAANVGGFDTVEDMRKNIREQFERSRAVAHARVREQRARAALAQRLQGEVPEAMIETTRDHILRDFLNGLESRNLSLEQYLQAMGIDGERLLADFREQAAESVREELALEALFRELGMEVTEEDVEKLLEDFATAAESDAVELRQRWEDAGVLKVVHEQIMHQKAVQWLMDDANVEVIEKQPSEEGSEGDAATARTVE